MNCFKPLRPLYVFNFYQMNPYYMIFFVSPEKIFRTISWAVLLLLVVLTMNAQNGQGIVDYKYTLYTEEGSGFPGMPSSYDIMTKLNYTDSESFFERDKDVVEVIDPTDRRARWISRMMQNRISSYYKNVKENQMIESVHLFGKNFIIPDSLPSRKWKISAGEQKDILGYLCMKAIYRDSSENVIVYFTPQIPWPHGPADFNGLPGIILEVQSADFHILAQNVTTGNSVISIPRDGEQMTRESFNTLREEKMKERQEMWGDRSRRRP